MAKRTYTRRSDNERIEELEAKLAKVKARLAERKLRDSVLHRETNKIVRSLRKYAQVAVDEGREDIANSALAFLAGLDRLASSEMDAPRSARASSAARPSGSARTSSNGA